MKIMKIMNVQVSIDVNNPIHVDALKQFMDALADNVNAAKKQHQPTKSVDKEEHEDDKPALSEKEARAKRLAARKARAEAERSKEEDEDNEEPEIKIATLRKLTREKIEEDEDNRDEIDEQLAKYKVGSVSSIPENKYKDYYDFITNL
jgi:hypothetical protein